MIDPVPCERLPTARPGFEGCGRTAGLLEQSTTIVAPASGRGRAGVAVIRISGPASRQSIEQFCGAAPAARRASLRRIVDPRTGELLDHGLVLWFPGPASFTGEDAAEFHLHGARSVVAAVLRVLTDFCGCRLAEPGEFARRAFANGKLDLPAVEGLADLIDSETEAQRRQALRQMDGVLGRQTQEWSSRLLDVIAWAEAALDFSDEGDVPARSLAQAIDPARVVAGEIAAALIESVKGERLRDGFVVAIAGPPNAGKSTLLNSLAKRDVAIVSPFAGTTRDVLEVRLELGGLPVILTDLAGIRDSSDPIEIEGIARAKRRIEVADLVLWLSAWNEPAPAPALPHDRVILVRTKADTAPGSDSGPEFAQGFINLSAKQGLGVDTLLTFVEDQARATVGSGDALVAHERQRTVLDGCLRHLTRALDAFDSGLNDEFVAEDLRLAHRALARMSGHFDVEDVLGAIFSRF
ncbi:MAG: tRNA uridine-5-carboxymethylaminomethyl(34) synthesis GTPase MnmE [Rhizobiales bacterium]|nr:tRNA uridine-5-carboxymethylaminomethyl(34) synthesis GTPase MnmE [Hyphomicrobiales bacterium]